MSKRKALDESRCTDDVCSALARSPDLKGTHQSGSHLTFQGPYGSVVVPVGHGGSGGKQLPYGTYKSILKMAALAGLTLLALALVLLWL